MFKNKSKSSTIRQFAVGASNSAVDIRIWKSSCALNTIAICYKYIL